MSDKVWRCYTTTALYEKETGRFKNIKTTNDKWQEDSFFWKLLHTLIFYIFCIILQRGGVDDIFPSDYDPKPNYPYITLVSIQNYTPQHKADQAGSTNTFIWFHFLLGNANLQSPAKSCTMFRWWFTILFFQTCRLQPKLSNGTFTFTDTWQTFMVGCGLRGAVGQMWVKKEEFVYSVWICREDVAVVGYVRTTGFTAWVCVCVCGLM